MNFNDYRELLPSYIEHNKRVSTNRGLFAQKFPPVLLATRDVSSSASASQDEISIISSTGAPIATSTVSGHKIVE